MAESLFFGEAEQKDIPACEALFFCCFGAAEEGKLVLRQQGGFRIFCVKEKERIVAMLTAMPVSVTAGEEQLSAVYLYGIATHPEKRGEGLCTALMEYVHHTMAGEGTSLFLLVPSTPQNRIFYGKRGYRDCSWLCRGEVSASKVESPLLAEPIDSAEYKTLRARFCPTSRMDWGTEGLAFQQEWLRLYGGGFWRFGSREEPCGCAALNQEENNYFVRELLTAPQQIDAALAALNAKLNAATLSYCLAQEQGTARGFIPQPFAMRYDTSPESRRRVPELYVNLALD